MGRSNEVRFFTDERTTRNREDPSDMKSVAQNTFSGRLQENSKVSLLFAFRDKISVPVIIEFAILIYLPLP